MINKGQILPYPYSGLSQRVAPSIIWEKLEFSRMLTTLNGTSIGRKLNTQKKHCINQTPNQKQPCQNKSLHVHVNVNLGSVVVFSLSLSLCHTLSLYHPFSRTRISLSFFLSNALLNHVHSIVLAFTFFLCNQFSNRLYPFRCTPRQPRI